MVFNTGHSTHWTAAVMPETDDTPLTDEPDSQARKFQRELTAGLTSLVLLSVLAEADSDLYGYEIAKRLSGAGDRPSPFKQGALYPVLRNMSAAGLLASRVVPSYSGPPRRYYRITPLGRDVLGNWRATWSDTRDFVDSIVQRSPAPETSS
jgi:PadR family transcriptional regulator PadR